MIRRLIAGTILMILSPPLLLIAILMILDDGFPIFFRQRRIGKDNYAFQIFKLRTMKNNVPDIATHLLENPAAFYTRLGQILRKLSIDEIPQLINVFIGDMNFIGPRPALHNQYDLIQMRSDRKVHRMKPGITGWAQVNGRDELSIEEKVILDEYYLNNASWKLDLKILFMTVVKVLGRKDVSK